MVAWFSYGHFSSSPMKSPLIVSYFIFSVFIVFFKTIVFVLFSCTWFFFSSKTNFLDILGFLICFILNRFFFSSLSPILFSLVPAFCSSCSFAILSQPSREGAGAFIPLAFQMLTRVFWRMSDWQTNTSPKYSECTVTNSFILVNTVSKITLDRDRPYF